MTCSFQVTSVSMHKCCIRKRLRGVFGFIICLSYTKIERMGLDRTQAVVQSTVGSHYRDNKVNLKSQQPDHLCSLVIAAKRVCKRSRGCISGPVVILSLLFCSYSDYRP